MGLPVLLNWNETLFALLPQHGNFSNTVLLTQNWFMNLGILFRIQRRIKRRALPYPEILLCLIKFCLKKKKTDLDTVPLPNNYVLLGTARERYGV